LGWVRPGSGFLAMIFSLGRVESVFLNSGENFGPRPTHHVVGSVRFFPSGLGRVYQVGRPMIRSSLSGPLGARAARGEGGGVASPLPLWRI
jgi:hypothetical protein